MKKVLLIIVLAFLFVQCKKDDIQNVNDEAKIPVKLELSMNQDNRTLFGLVLPEGKILWGNECGREYLYMAVPNCTIYDGKVLGEMIELTAEFDIPSERMVFTGEIPESKLLKEGIVELYYFGSACKENNVLNVKKLYHKGTGIHIGMNMVLSVQKGNMEELGNYHLAKITATVSIKKDIKGNIYIDLREEKIENLNSIVKLDLLGIKKLYGTAVAPQYFKVQWNEETMSFEEYREEVPNSCFYVNEKNEKYCYISLLPKYKNVYLESPRGRIYFDDLRGGQIYIGKMTGDIDEALPLQWEYIGE